MVINFKLVNNLLYLYRMVLYLYTSFQISWVTHTNKASSDVNKGVLFF